MKLCLFAAKNVAADIAEKLCDSVAAKLEGKVLGTFGSMCHLSLSKHPLNTQKGLQKIDEVTVFTKSAGLSVKTNEISF